MLPSRAGGRPIPPLHNPYALPTCHTADDVAHILMPIVCSFGPHIARHPSLMVKLLRVARVVLAKAEESGSGKEHDVFYYEFLSALDEALLPGLSVLSCNPCIAEEIWETIKFYPYEYRYIRASMAVSPWLNSLSTFCGAVYKKYPIELCGVLQFIANQLKAERSVDLLILQEILQKMGGTDTSEGLTSEQIEAMSGGEVLRREAGTYQQERNTKRSSQRLKEVLLQNNLAIPLLLLIAQQRSCIVYNQTESPHLKLVGKLYDQCQETLAQFGAYLFQVISLEEVSERLPSIGSLLSECHINSDVAFFLARPTVSAKILARFDELRRSNRSDDRKQLYIDASTEVLTPLAEEIRPHFPSKLWEEMHPSFFVTFWTLNLSDLEVPTGSYKREVARFNDNITQLQKVPKDEPAALATKRKKELERIMSLRDKLLEEENRQQEHVDREKERWFTQRVACLPKNDTVTAFLQLCLFPRCTFTTLDALYCARFVKMMHELKTPNFSTLIFCDRVNVLQHYVHCGNNLFWSSRNNPIVIDTCTQMFCDITYTVASCTEQEAHRYGQFLHGTLQMVMHWHSSSDNYERECAKFPGFVTRFRVSKMESNDYVDYENYRHVVHKWHFKITKALVTCLESGDYIQIRNAILVLQSILTCFPAIVNLANVIDKRIEKVKKDEKNNRNDLYVLANSYSGRLRAKKSKLLQEKDFHQVRKPDEKRPPQQGGEPATNGVDPKGSEEDKKVDHNSSTNDSSKLDNNTNDQNDADSRRKDAKRNKTDADDDDVKEVGPDSDESTNDSDSLRSECLLLTILNFVSILKQEAEDGWFWEACMCWRGHARKTHHDESVGGRVLVCAAMLGEPGFSVAHCQPYFTLQNNDDPHARVKQPQDDSPNKRKKERKRERSVDEAVDGDPKRQRGDRRSNGRPIEQVDAEVVELDRDDKKRSSRRRKET
ncbi:hypothetical protein HAZT_HAZT001113 [Hyalella azteca]|uniref:THO complex subunit 2 n=1 Tax=Hyalella azteca TaxID=294128 RepID=A0A6A0GT66_HYAAZ|nr:hypothetical protein HAZT_HAZT001113 [Hyalella azteca]